MAFDIVTLSPFNVQLGGNEAGANPYLPLPAPVAIGDGSLADNSDSTGYELGSRYNGDEGGDRADLLLVDFAIDTGAHPEPTWMYPSVRVKNADGYLDASAAYGLIGHYGWYRADDPTGTYLYLTGWPTPLSDGEATTPTWFDQVYNNAPILPGDPGDDTNWLNLPRDWPQILDPLTTTGLRFGIFCLSTATTRVPLVDVFEVRLVVACAPVAAPAYVPPTRATPSLRMLQRGGEGGMSGIPRMIGNPVRGLRQGPGSVY